MSGEEVDVPGREADGAEEAEGEGEVWPVPRVSGGCGAIGLDRQLVKEVR